MKKCRRSHQYSQLMKRRLRPTPAYGFLFVRKEVQDKIIGTAILLLSVFTTWREAIISKILLSEIRKSSGCVNYLFDRLWTKVLKKVHRYSCGKYWLNELQFNFYKKYYQATLEGALLMRIFTTIKLKTFKIVTKKANIMPGLFWLKQLFRLWLHEYLEPSRYAYIGVCEFFTPARGDWTNFAIFLQSSNSPVSTISHTSLSPPTNW